MVSGGSLDRRRFRPHRPRADRQGHRHRQRQRRAAGASGCTRPGDGPRSCAPCSGSSARTSVTTPRRTAFVRDAARGLSAARDVKVAADTLADLMQWAGRDGADHRADRKRATRKPGSRATRPTCAAMLGAHRTLEGRQDRSRHAGRWTDRYLSQGLEAMQQVAAHPTRRRLPRVAEARQVSLEPARAARGLRRGYPAVGAQGGGRSRRSAGRCTMTSPCCATSWTPTTSSLLATSMSACRARCRGAAAARARGTDRRAGPAGVRRDAQGLAGALPALPRRLGRAKRRAAE